MTRTRTPELTIGQDALLSMEEVAVPNQLQAPEMPAPFVSIAERSKHLERALGLLNEANKLTGFVTGGEAPQHRPEIERRYESATDRVLQNSGSKVGKLELQIMHSFAYASGLYALRTSGVPHDTARKITREAYDEFTDIYGVGRTNYVERNKLAEKLNKQRTRS